MLRRDYIQHMIEEFGRLLGRALGLREEKLPGEALRLIRESYPEFFKLEAEFLDSVQPNVFVPMLEQRDDFTITHFDLLAQAQQSEGDLLREEHPELARDRYAKALAIFKHLEVIDHTTYSIRRKEAIAALEVSSRD